jgi:hypothetical protein
MKLAMATDYDVCCWCGGPIIDSEMAEEDLCRNCTEVFIALCLEEESDGPAA